MNNEILEEVDLLVDEIKNSQTYQKYQKIKEKMKQNQELMETIHHYKTCQQQLVKAEYNKQQENQEHLEKELKQLDQQLKAIPIYVEYLALQEELNDLFSQIKAFFDHYFEKKLNQE